MPTAARAAWTSSVAKSLVWSLPRVFPAGRSFLALRSLAGSRSSSGTPSHGAMPRRATAASNPLSAVRGMAIPPFPRCRVYLRRSGLSSEPQRAPSLMLPPRPTRRQPPTRRGCTCGLGRRGDTVGCSKGVPKRCHELARDDTMPVAQGKLANWPGLLIVALGRARVWDVHPHLARGGCRWQRGKLPLWTSGLGIPSAMPLFLAVQNRQAHSPKR